ncbi:hypothetical protein [Planktothrix agardhii]|uniref:hypothetical protein n=1 Tax=Planktothrix agardhii TaxID=1160 RepID=UPI001F2A2D23|nr:hypothetical protein [Planktothrix agardhii]
MLDSLKVRLYPNKVFVAVKVWFCSGVPVILTVPVGASLILATTEVGLLLTVSAVPNRSV